MSRSSVLRRILPRTAVLAVSGAVVLASCAASGPDEDSPGASTAATSPAPIVIDTDMSSDDIMAIAYLTARAELDIRAITVAGTGVVHCAAGERNVLNLLHELNHAPIPVACGSSEAPAGVRPIPDVWRLEADNAYGLVLAESPETPRDSGPELIAQVIRDSPEPVALLTLGPLTNVAAALELDDGLAGAIAQIVVMGGAVGVPGNASFDGGDADAEWNLASDPPAAATVLGSGIPILLVPLDATNHVPVSQGFVDALRLDVDAGPADLVDEILTKNSYLVGGSSFWDPLAAVGLIDPSVLTVEDARIAIELEGPAAGRTHSTQDGALVALAIAADPVAFERAFLAGLRSGPPRVTPFAGGGAP